MPRANDDVKQATGAYRRQCPVCATEFYTDDPRVVYDTVRCKKRADNAAYYDRHRADVLAKANARKDRQRAIAAEVEALREFKRQAETALIFGDRASWGVDPYDEQEASSAPGASGHE